MKEDEITEKVIGAAIKVHEALGPGLLESAYEQCLAYELKVQGLKFKQQHPMPLTYEEVKLDVGYRMDIWVEEKVVLEIKAVESLTDVHLAQILTYLRLTENKVGLLLNFNVSRMLKGIKRVVNNY